MTKSAEKWIKMRLTEEEKDARKRYGRSLANGSVRESEFWRGVMSAYENALLIFKEGTK